MGLDLSVLRNDNRLGKTIGQKERCARRRSVTLAQSPTRLGSRRLTMRRTDSRTAASWTASEHDVVVFPIPQRPLSVLIILIEHTDTSFTTCIRQLDERNNGAVHPPQKIHFKLFWSSTFCNVGGSGSKSSDMVMIRFYLDSECARMYAQGWNAPE